nr:hypothetical protein K-LCC10_0445 [Kaumoebavirus]
MIRSIYFPRRVRNTRDYNVIEECREQFHEAKLVLVHKDDGDYVMCWEEYKKDIKTPHSLDDIYNLLPKPTKNLVRSIDVEEYLRIYQRKVDSLRTLKLFF